MAPNQRRVWTYRQRANSLNIKSGIIIVPLMFLGVYIGVTEGNWTLFAIAGVGLLALILLVLVNRHDFKDEP